MGSLHFDKVVLTQCFAGGNEELKGVAMPVLMVGAGQRASRPALSGMRPSGGPAPLQKVKWNAAEVGPSAVEEFSDFSLRALLDGGGGNF